MTNPGHTVLYTGITNDLQRRVLEHRSGEGSAFTRRYHLTELVYFECGNDVREAIAREKQIKAGPRRKKLALIQAQNPAWEDLYELHFGP